MTGVALSGSQDALARRYRLHHSRTSSRVTLPPPSAGEGTLRSRGGEGSDASGIVAPLSRPSLTRGPPSPAEGGGKHALCERETVHATCVVVGEAGVLIRGESRAGKSSLALALIERTTRQGGFAALVGDDRVRVEARHGHVVARPHPAIAGLIEMRGHGIVAMDHVPACILRLVVDLVAPGPCLPEPQEPEVAILGVALPCLRIDRAARDAGLAPGLVAAMLLAATPGVSSQSHTPPQCGEAPAPRSAGAAGVA